MLIDSHCHLDLFDPAEVAPMLARAAAAGVAEMVTIGTRLCEAATQIALAQAHPTVWATIGTHPDNAAEHALPDPPTIAALATHPRVIGIGETGLDYFHQSAPRDIQQASLRAHIAAARTARVPVIIHTREADADMAAILTEEQAAGPFAFLLHCFSSSHMLAQAAIALGGYISLSGILSFPKSGALRDIARDLPPDRLLVETDAPYLAPVPHRGRRNEPAYVAATAAVLAGLHDITPSELATLTTTNFRRLFPKTRPTSTTAAQPATA